MKFWKWIIFQKHILYHSLQKPIHIRTVLMESLWMFLCIKTLWTNVFYRNEKLQGHVWSWDIVKNSYVVFLYFLFVLLFVCLFCFFVFRFWDFCRNVILEIEKKNLWMFISKCNSFMWWFWWVLKTCCLNIP